MGAPISLSDEHLCILDLLMRARDKGVARVSRTEILSNEALPASARIKLTWAALTMPEQLLAWHGRHEFSITDAGVAAYRLAFGAASRPSRVADSVICLPDLSHARAS